MFIFSGKFLSHLLKFYGAWRSAGYRVLLRKLVRFKRDHKFQILWVRIMEVHQDLNLAGSIQTCVGFLPPHSSPFFGSAIKFRLRRKKGGKKDFSSLKDSMQSGDWSHKKNIPVWVILWANFLFSCVMLYAFYRKCCFKSHLPTT